MSKTFRHHTALISGIALHWLSLGKKSEQAPVVMLHGLNDSAESWASIGKELASDRLVLIPDLPGHGHSGRPDASYELAWYASIMAEWMAHLDIRSADLIGHSFGGGVAQVMLLHCRERIQRLVLVSSGGLGREINIALRIASIPLVVEYLGQPFMKICTKIALKLSRDGRSQSDIEVLCELSAKVGSARVFSRTVRDVINWQGQRQGYKDRIHEVKDLPPILILWGEKDPIIPAMHAQVFVESFENVKLAVFKGCGHYPHYQQSKLFVQKLQDFFAETPAKVTLKASGQ